MKILISAAETSSDAHGAELLKALRKELAEPATLEAFGVGGPKLQAAGLRTVVDARELLAMGFLEILGRLPRIFGALKAVTQAARIERPDIAVVIDYPDFHFRLARRLKKLGIPVVYYIPPKVWAWRKKRIHALRDSFVKVLSILPFEESFYARENVPVKYVGNPLVDELPLQQTREAARTMLEIPATAQVLLLMPGSRPSEVKRHLELLLDSATRAAALMRSQRFLAAQERLVTLLPFPQTSSLAEMKARVDSWALRAGVAPILDLRVSQGDAPECMVAANAGLIKSGTSTLEAGMLRLPHAVVYKPGFLTEWIFKLLIRYQGPVGLVNLVAGSEAGAPFLVREILMSKATVKTLSAEILSLFTDGLRRNQLLEGFENLRARVIGGSPESPSTKAAQEILALC